MGIFGLLGELHRLHPGRLSNWSNRRRDGHHCRHAGRQSSPLPSWSSPSSAFYAYVVSLWVTVEYTAVMLYYVGVYTGKKAVITDYVCYTWGGLKGALPLLLGLQLYEYSENVKNTHPQGEID